MMMKEQALLLRRTGIGGMILLLGFGACLVVLASTTPPPSGEPAVSLAVGGCVEADAAAVQGLKQLMDSSDRRATVLSSTVFRTIAEARNQCRHGDSRRAMELYGFADQVVRRFSRGTPSYED